MDTLLVKQQKKALPLTEYNLRIVCLIMSNDNQWFAGEAVNHPPSHIECTDHFIQGGGLAHFHEQYEILQPGQNAA